MSIGGEPEAREITSHALYLRRREFVSGSFAGIAWAALGASLAGPLFAVRRARAGVAAEALRRVPAARPPYRGDDSLTSRRDVTHHNNFYELGSGKQRPARNAERLKIEPWSVSIEGEVARPGRVAIEDLIRPGEIEERVYRLRCVEAWSMVIPWLGVPLARVLRRFEPASNARYVAFESLLDPQNLPGQRSDSLRWPYREGLRIDEAMHPLTLLAVGLYGEPLPAQNGAPLRVIVPWKYGFKSIKSIVRIRLQREKPPTSWNEAAPREYGFYANVNPAVAHPRWSQARERRIGEWRKRPTLPFNGYAEEVASLYRGVDLRREF